MKSVSFTTLKRNTLLLFIQMPKRKAKNPKRSKKKKKDTKKARRARKLANSLPRDAKGKFLPRGSRNLFRKRKRRRSAPARRRTKRVNTRRRRSVPATKRNMGSRTGGTGDVKPQILTLGTQKAAAADDYITAQIPLPVPRFGFSKAKATIFELLWVDWYLAMEDFDDPLSVNWAWLSTVQTRTTADTSNLATLAEDILNPRAFAFAIEGSHFITSGASTHLAPIHIDLNDNNGNGMLVATDRLQITGGNQGGSAGSSYTCKVGYRLVNVGVQEYVGIIQSQQGSSLIA